MTNLWLPVDPLGEALHFLRMNESFYTRAECTAPWGFELPALGDCLMFHVVTSGCCWLDVDGAEPGLLRPGALALVPHGARHRLRSEPSAYAAPLFDLRREHVSEGTKSCGTVRAVLLQAWSAVPCSLTIPPHGSRSGCCRA